MEFEGHFNSSLSVEGTMEYLSDFRKVSCCLPGVESVDVQANQYIARIRFDVSEFGHSYMSTLSGRLKAHYETAGNNHVVISASGRIAGSAIKVLLDMAISQSDGKTVTSWKASVDFGILMKIMGEKNIMAVADANIGRIMSCIGKAISPV